MSPLVMQLMVMVLFTTHEHLSEMVNISYEAWGKPGCNDAT